MDKDNNKTLGSEILFDIITPSNPIKTIFIVKYKEIFYAAESKINKTETYNLFAFEDSDVAIMYMNLAHSLIVNPLVANGEFKILFKRDSDDLVPEPEGSKTLSKICTKLIGNDERHKSQTKFFTFSVDKINFRSL